LYYPLGGVDLTGFSEGVLNKTVTLSLDWMFIGLKLNPVDG
jgi:hypothetical protein